METQNVEQNVEQNIDTKPTEKMYSQAELDKVVAEKIAEKSKELLSMTDSKVSKALETQKNKFGSEKSNYEEQLNLLRGEVEQLRFERNVSNNKTDAQKMLIDNGIDVSVCGELLNSLVNDNKDTSMNNIQNLINVMSGLKTSVEDNVKKQYAHIPQPTSKQSVVEMTQEQFEKLDYEQMIKFSRTNPELFEKFTQS